MLISTLGLSVAQLDALVSVAVNTNLCTFAPRCLDQPDIRRSADRIQARLLHCLLPSAEVKEQTVVNLLGSRPLIDALHRTCDSFPRRNICITISPYTSGDPQVDHSGV